MWHDPALPGANPGPVLETDPVRRCAHARVGEPELVLVPTGGAEIGTGGVDPQSREEAVDLPACFDHWVRAVSPEDPTRRRNVHPSVDTDRADVRGRADGSVNGGVRTRSGVVDPVTGILFECQQPWTTRDIDPARARETRHLLGVFLANGVERRPDPGSTVPGSGEPDTRGVDHVVAPELVLPGSESITLRCRSYSRNGGSVVVEHPVHRMVHKQVAVELGHPDTGGSRPGFETRSV